MCIKFVKKGKEDNILKKLGVAVEFTITRKIKLYHYSYINNNLKESCFADTIKV